jgi:hypothetical protein
MLHERDVSTGLVLLAHYGVVFRAVLGDEDKASDDCTMSDVRPVGYGCST